MGATVVTNRQGFRAGWTVGGGIEYAVAQNWTVKLDYLYYDLGRQRLGGDLGGGVTQFFDVKSTGHIARVGVNYLFSTGPSAVVARY